MTISAKEKELFKEWKKRRESLVADGAVSEQYYLESCPKIAFILKETNDPGFCDPRKFLRDGGRWQTWNSVARWVHGIRNLPSEAIGLATKKIDTAFRREMLGGIVVMNLKKSPGGSSTNDADLEKVAGEDAEYIRMQYALYDPDITICGGEGTTGELLRKVVHPKMSWKQTTGGVRWYWRDTHKCVVEFIHPAARVRTARLLGDLLDAIKEIKEEQE